MASDKSAEEGVSASGLCPHLSRACPFSTPTFGLRGSALFLRSRVLLCLLPREWLGPLHSPAPGRGRPSVTADRGARTGLSRRAEEQENVLTGPHSPSLPPASVSENEPAAGRAPEGGDPS